MQQIQTVISSLNLSCLFLVGQRRVVFLNQRKYVFDLLQEKGMLGARSADSPIEVNHRLHDQKSDLLLNPNSYQRLVGRLIYLTITRPELLLLML